MRTFTYQYIRAAGSISGLPLKTRFFNSEYFPSFEHSPSGVYSFGAHRDRLPPSSRDFGYPVPRRLVSSPPRPSGSTLLPVSVTEYARPGGFCSEQEEIRTGPSTGYLVSWCSVAPGSGKSLPSRVQGSGDYSTGVRVVFPMSSVVSKSGSVYGLTQLDFRSDPSWTDTPEAVTATFSLLRPDEPVYTSTTASVRPAGPCQHTSAVEGPIFSNIRYPHPAFPGGFHNFYRRLYAGLGAPIWGIPKSRVPGPVRIASSISIVGAQGGSCCPMPLGFSAPGPPGFDRYRHYNSSFLYQQTSRNPFPNLVASSSGSLYVTAGSGHSSQIQAHTSLFECDIRPPIQTQSANFDRVESPFRDRQSNFPVLGNSNVRHVRHSPQYPIHVYFMSCLRFRSL